MTERESQRIARIDEKMEQMKAQKQDILAKEKKRQRNERTRRLIEIGAITEKYLGVKDIQPQYYELFLKAILETDGIKEKIVHFRGQISQNTV